MFASLSNDIFPDDTHRRRRYITILDPHISNIVNTYDFGSIVDDSLRHEIEGLIAKALVVIVLSFFGVVFLVYYVISGGVFLHESG